MRAPARSPRDPCHACLPWSSPAAPLEGGRASSPVSLGLLCEELLCSGLGLQPAFRPFPADLRHRPHLLGLRGGVGMVPPQPRLSAPVSTDPSWGVSTRPAVRSPPRSRCLPSSGGVFAGSALPTWRCQAEEVTPGLRLPGPGTCFLQDCCCRSLLLLQRASAPSPGLVPRPI